PELGNPAEHRSSINRSVSVSGNFRRQIRIDCLDALIPHPAAILVLKQNRALQKILVITIDRAADVTVSIRPLSGLNIDPRSNQTDARAAVVDFDQRALRLVIKNLSMR